MDMEAKVIPKLVATELALEDMAVVAVVDTAALVVIMEAVAMEDMEVIVMSMDIIPI